MLTYSLKVFTGAWLMISAVITPALATQDEPATWFLVRHAEKEETGPDPHLSPAGRERAEQLAALLSAAGIDTVLSSDYHRTRETAEPLATRLGLEIEVYDPSALQELAQALLERGGRALVVGHSNTTPELAARLGGEPGPEIDEADEYDRLYLLTRDASGRLNTVVLRYGKPFTR